MRTAIVLFYRVLGFGSIVNGIWMLASSYTWFTGVPAAVPDTGPLNEHFVHDLGVVFIIAGIGSLWCAVQRDYRNPVHAGLVLFFGGHALIHVVEIVAGRLPPAHWLIDAPLTFLPAIILILIGFAPRPVAP